MKGAAAGSPGGNSDKLALAPPMSDFPSGPTRSEIVRLLRAAGCVFADDEARLLISTAQTKDDLAAMVERRASGLPLEQVVGWAEFCGLRVAVEPGVFVPRRRTELLVREAVGIAVPEPVVVDLCCGSGAVGMALAAALNRIELYAVDIDAVAVRCARTNLAPTGARVYLGDLFQPLPPDLRGRVDLLVANAPYVPTDALAMMPAEARVHEPRAALDGGEDGLDVMRRLATEARRWLTPGGHLLVETSEAQAPQAVDAIVRHGMVPRVASSDELDATVVIGTHPDR
ncbi:MAG: release factor glutamine methyltransferase [Nocardioidaceae bacterium]|nr:release factor glutamine methyltransferase [Nocardioidaceae bacterium]